MEYNIQQLKSFIFGIANDALVDVYEAGDYKKIILPMMVIRRFDAVLEKTKQNVLNKKKFLDDNGITNQSDALCTASGQAFYNDSPFTMNDLKNRASKQKLKTDFETYLAGFSKNVQDIIKQFKFLNEIETLSETGSLAKLIEKFVDKKINLSSEPVLNDDGSVRIPALDNHTMGTVFEEVIRTFNEDFNIVAAGRHFTPRDIIELMADFAFVPVKDKIKDATYLVYDGACGTGGMLTEADKRLKALAEKNKKTVSIKLYGQEIQPETYATSKADMLMKGEGEQADNIYLGSTISDDGFADKTFHFCISNPPFGTNWSKDEELMGGKKKITDPRFVVSAFGEAEYSMLPDVGDPQMLFLLNNVSKMKDDKFGTRIIEVHNGSSLFSCGNGGSNARRYLLENDLVEAIVALPEKIFYNTGIGTFIWIVTNRKEDRRKGKVQLIDATSFKQPLRKNLGERNSELSKEMRKEILALLMNFEENEHSKIFDNTEFGYIEVPILRPEKDENGNIIKDKKGNPKPDKTKDTEQIPLNYNGGIDEFFKSEVLPYFPDAWMDKTKLKVCYDISFTKYFYKPVELRNLSEIIADIKALERQSDGLLDEILG